MSLVTVGMAGYSGRRKRQAEFSRLDLESGAEAKVQQSVLSKPKNISQTPGMQRDHLRIWPWHLATWRDRRRAHRKLFARADLRQRFTKTADRPLEARHSRMSGWPSRPNWNIFKSLSWSFALYQGGQRWSSVACEMKTMCEYQREECDKAKRRSLSGQDAAGN